MKTVLNVFLSNEKGYALVITLGFLVIGGLVIVPTLAHIYTGLRANQVHKERMMEYYAADAAVEDAIHKIVSNHEPLQALDMNDSYSYDLGDPINGITPISTTVTKQCLLDDILDPSEYKLDRPHEGWIGFGSPLETEQKENYTEYSCNITLENTGSGSRTIQKLGVFFCPLISDESLISGPSDIVYSGNISDSMLEADTPETSLAPGGFAFVWEWQGNKGPTFKVGDTGALSFTFQVYDLEWEHGAFFAFIATKEEDISFITSNPVPYKWLIEANAAGAEIKSCVVEYTDGLDILTWDVK